MLPEYFESVMALKLVSRRYLDRSPQAHTMQRKDGVWAACRLVLGCTRRAKPDLFGDGGIDDRFRMRMAYKLSKTIDARTSLEIIGKH